jgi:hypothetical protein
MEAQQGGAFFKTSARRDGVMYVQLSITTLEVSAADARLHFHGSVGDTSFSHLRAPDNRADSAEGAFLQ